MSIQKLNTNGLGLRFKIKGEHVVFLTENGEEKATRPATPAELVLWGELFQKIGDVERLDKNLAKADEQTLKLTKILQRFPKVTTEELRNPVSKVDEMLRAATEMGAELTTLQEELTSFGEWLDREFPGELNETEGLLGTVARLLRDRKGQGRPKQAPQRGGVATREAKGVSLSPEDAALAKPIVQEGP